MSDQETPGVLQVAGLARSLQTGLTCSLASNTEQWRRSLAQLDRRHSKQFRAARSSLGKKRDTLLKVEKKLKKGKYGREKQQKLGELQVLLDRSAGAALHCRVS